jgi:hypothetical protein
MLNIVKDELIDNLVKNKLLKQIEKDVFEHIKIDMNNKEVDHTCSICRNDFDETTIKLKRCTHCFHSECIAEWYNTSKNYTCPICTKLIM